MTYKLYVALNIWIGKVLLVCILFFLSSPAFSTVVVPSTIISKDTVWKSDTVSISSDLIVNEKATLTIEPGVVVVFQGPFSITVYGALNALGNSNDSIRFVPSRGMEEIGWGGIRFLANRKASVLKYCEFSYSLAEQGGAICAFNGFSLEISNCAFSNNYAAQGGALYIESTPITVANSRIFNCTSLAEGGGIYMSSCNMATISGNYIYNNKAKGFGGGIYAESTKSLIQYNRILNNICLVDAKVMCGGGGMALLFGSESVLNNVVCNNETNSMGGGIIYIAGNGQFVNNTICNNKASQGGGISLIEANTDMYNSLVWNNQSTDVSPIKSHNVYINAAKAARFRNCLIKTGADYLVDNEKASVFIDHIESNPLFIEPFVQTGFAAGALNASWLPGSGSPCLDAGDKSANITEYDIEGNLRVVNTSVDIGAYEVQQELAVIGIIDSDRIWYGKIKVVGDVTVARGAKLTIHPGTQVNFTGAYGISVNGQLIAKGEPQKNILFTRDVTRKNLYPSSPEDGWKGIRFSSNDNGAASQLDFCILEYCSNVSPGISKLGGAMTCNQASILNIRNSIIRYCASDYGGAILAMNGASVSAVNSLFYGNFSSAGGVFYVQRAKLRALNCTLYNNTAVEGGALYCQSASPEIENTILWKNLAPGGDQIYLADENSDPNIIYSVVEKDIKSIGGPGSGNLYSGAFRNNLDKNPLFNNPDRDNQFTLKKQSPCINAGNPGTTQKEAGQLDLLGDSRFKQTIIDIGAYEYQGILLSKPIPDLSLIANSNAYTVDLSAHFSTTGVSNTLQFKAFSNGGSAVTLQLSGNILQITPKINTTGIDTIRINAESSYGAELSDTFLVRVNYAQLTLQSPFNNYRFILNEDRVFKWSPLSINQAGVGGYVVKIAEMQSLQTPEQAIASNNLWYSDTVAPVSANVVSATITPKFPAYGKLAWQICAINSNKNVVGISPVQVFYGAPLLASFYAGTNLVRVDTTIEHRLDNISGIGSITVPEKGIVSFGFKDLSLVSSGNIYTLNGGSITIPFSDTIILNPSYLPNGNARLLLDSLYINKDGFAVRTSASWEISVSQSTRLDALPNKMSYNNFQLSGNVMLTGASFALDALPGAKMSIDNRSFISVKGNNTFSPNITGTISYPVSDRSSFMNDSVRFAFTNVSTIDNFQGNSANQASLGLNTLVNVTPVQFFVDLSKAKSPFNYDSNWEGIAVKRFSVTFNNRNVDYPLSLTSADGVIFDSGPVSMFNISADGIKLRIDTTFSMSIPSRFNGYEGSIKTIRFNRSGNGSAREEITGGIVIPFIDENFENSYVLNFDDQNYYPEMRPRLTDFSLNPYSEKSIDEIQLISGFQRFDGSIDQANRLIQFIVPDSINIQSKAIYFIARGNKVTIATFNIVRDQTLCDFSSPVVLRVYAGNGSYLDYVVTVLKNATAIEEPESAVSVFPNPAQDFIKITGDNLEGSQVLVFDVRGILKATTYIESSETVLPISSFASGVYILHIKKKDSVKSYRVIKE